MKADFVDHPAQSRFAGFAGGVIVGIVHARRVSKTASGSIASLDSSAVSTPIGYRACGHRESTASSIASTTCLLSPASRSSIVCDVSLRA